MPRVYLSLLLAATALVQASCSQAGSTSGTGSESATGAAGSVTTTLDTEANAREFAATYVNQQVEGKAFTDDKGQPVTPPKVNADTWAQAQKEGDRWTLKRGPPGHWYFSASFNEDGSNPEYEAVYFEE